MGKGLKYKPTHPFIGGILLGQLALGCWAETIQKKKKKKKKRYRTGLWLAKVNMALNSNYY